jgi:acylphosphatase
MSVQAIRHVVIHGRVQGVGYRVFTEYAALDRGLTGWVRNRRDGAVEAVFAGPPEAVAAVIEACRRGPPGARVDAIEERQGTVGESEMRGREQFAVLPTA